MLFIMQFLLIMLLQFAKAVGATVIAITSTEEKAEKLKDLGADHVINYTAHPEWGQIAKELTGKGEGIDLVLDVVGGKTFSQSLNSIKLGGVVTMIGVLDGFNPAEWPSTVEILGHMCTVRAIAVGSKAHFEEMLSFINAHSIKPIIDHQVFEFEELKAAYEYLVCSRSPLISPLSYRREWSSDIVCLSYTFVSLDIDN